MHPVGGRPSIVPEWHAQGQEHHDVREVAGSFSPLVAAGYDQLGPEAVDPV